MYKMTILLGLLVAVMSVSAFGAGIIGTPTAELDQGQWNVGFNYTYIDMDLAKTKVTSSGALFDADGSLVDSGSESFKLAINDVKIQRYYGTIGYGLTESWEAYVQLGIADVKARMKSDDPDDEWRGFNFDNDFAWGWGTKYTFYEQDKVRWGASVQMNWLDTSWDSKETDEDFTSEEQFDYSTYDLIVAVGPTVDMGGWSLYGGPYYYMVSGDLDVDESEIWETGSETRKASGDLEEDSNFGGFVGAQFGLRENCNLTTELSLTGDGWAIGAGVCYAF